MEVLHSEFGTFDPPLKPDAQFTFAGLKNTLIELTTNFLEPAEMKEVTQFEIKKSGRSYFINVIKTSESENHFHELGWSLDLPNISRQRGTENSFFYINLKWNIGVHRNPLSSEVQMYLNEAEKILAKIKSDFHKDRNSNFSKSSSNKKEFLEQLADYYQYLICAHPFVRVNQSLFMNQINYLLYLRGFAPLYHGQIDFWAMTLPHTEFRRFFINEVMDQSNGIFSLE